jgi:hypothetical protein
MITLFRTGSYRLIETKDDTKVLYLDTDAYAWVKPKNIGEILVVSHNPHKLDCLLASGRYNLFTVIDEPSLTDLQHLELEVGRHTWQGYLLLTGLPDDHKKRARIIPTVQLITKTSLLNKNGLSRSALAGRSSHA